MSRELQIVHIVCGTGFAGVERHVARLARAQAAAGLRPTVVGGDPAAMRELLAEELAWLPSATIRDALRTATALREVDVLHTHMTSSDVAGALAGLRHRAPVVSTRHFAARRGHRLATRVALAPLRSFITRQIAISRFVADNVEGPSVVVHSGVPADMRPPAPRRKTVLVAQRLEPEKSTELVLHAWRRLGDRRGWRLVILGRGSQRSALEDLSRALGIDETVRFEDFTPHVAPHLRSSSVLVAPTPCEGLGLTVVEAMAVGTPVVAAGSGGHLETAGAASGETLFAPGDADALAERLGALLEDAGARARLGALLRAYQQRHLTLERQERSTRAVYEAVMA